MNTTNKKFTCPVIMEVTKEQFKELGTELEKLGYTSLNIGNHYDYPYICTNYCDNIQRYSNITKDGIGTYKRYYIDHYNKDLFLALAAMHEGTDHEQKLVGEYLKYNNNIFRVNSITDFENSYSKGTTNGYCVSYTKATKEEIIQHFKQNTNMNKTIIGYKAPMDMFNGKVTKGTIYKIDLINVNEEFNTCACSNSYTMITTNLPLELVKTWEPVYEEQKLLKVGKHDVAYDPSFVKIGCTNYTKKALNNAKEVLGLTNIKTILCEDGTEITLDIINQLLKGLEQ